MSEKDAAAAIERLAEHGLHWRKRAERAEARLAAITEPSEEMVGDVIRAIVKALDDIPGGYSYAARAALAAIAKQMEGT